MAQGVHKITEQFEHELCRYTRAPYAVAVDNCSNALFLALYYELNVGKGSYENVFGKKLEVEIPCHTYPSVACEVIHAGGKVEFVNNSEGFNFTDGCVKGMYVLNPTNVVDSALSFTSGMYLPSYHMCLSFTGPYKHLKLGKGGAILTDDINAYYWFKRARFSGRQECSYHEDDFDSTEAKDKDGYSVAFVPPIAGWNFYMMPEIAARGLQMMTQFYNQDGTPKHNKDLCLPYPDLSRFSIFKQ